MAKVVFIGAGSFGFTRGLVRDLLTFPRLADAQIALVDINKQRLDFARRACQKIIDQGKYQAKLVCASDRRQVLEGADAVMVTILCGSTRVWQHDILIPKQYGVDTNVGDTRGPSGIFRALRTIPEMLAIARDMEELCPKAIMLNYTNPMAMLCHAMQRETRVVSTGLCHSVQGTSAMLAGWAGVRPEAVDYVCAGINHMAWFTKFEHKGKDLYPRLRKRVATDPEIYNHEQVRNEMFLALDYYVTESSGHNSEYNWWFRKRPDLIRQHCTKGTGWNPGHYAYILKEYQKREKSWRQQVKAWLASESPISLKRGHEYAAYITNAWVGGEPVQIQRQRAQRPPHRQPAPGGLRRGAGAGHPQPVGADPGGGPAAPVRHAHRPERPDRDDGGGGLPQRRPAPHLPGRGPRPADRRGALAGGDQADGAPDAPPEPGVPAQLQAHRLLRRQWARPCRRSASGWGGRRPRRTGPVPSAYSRGTTRTATTTPFPT